MTMDEIMVNPRIRVKPPRATRRDYTAFEKASRRVPIF